MSIIAWGPQGLAVVRLKDEGIAGSSDHASTASVAISIPDRDIATVTGHLGTDTMMHQARDGLCLDVLINQTVLRQQILRFREMSVIKSAGFRNSQSEQVLLLNEWLSRVASCLTPESVAGHSVFFSLAELPALDSPSAEAACGPLTAYISSLRQRCLQQCGWCELPSPELAASMLGQLARRSPLSIDSLSAAIPIPLVQRCCAEGDLERAAAITLLHGFPGPAVQLLMLASDTLRESIADRAHAQARMAYGSHPYGRSHGGGAGYAPAGDHQLASDAMHAELLQLTAMAVAGCPGPALPRSGSRVGEPTGSADSYSGVGARSTGSGSREEGLAAAQREASRHVWLSSCRSLMGRIEGSRHPYLRMTLQVLIEVADPAQAAAACCSAPEEGEVADGGRHGGELCRDAETGERRGTGAAAHRHVPFADGSAEEVRRHTGRGLVARAPSGREPDPSGHGALGHRLSLDAGLQGRARPAHNLDTLGGARASAVRAGGSSLVHRGSGGAGREERSDGPEAPAGRDPEPKLPASSRHGSGSPARRKPVTATDVLLPLPPPAASQPLPRHATISGAAPGTDHSPAEGVASSAVDSASHIEISLHDRFAFACRFLEDGHVSAYIATLTAEVVERGRIDGLMLTGLTPAGSRLVQRYLDRTADVQTAAVVGCYMLRAAQLLLTARASQVQTTLIAAAKAGVTEASSHDRVPSAFEIAAEPAASPAAGPSNSLRTLQQLSSPEGLLRLLPQDAQRMVVLAWRWVQSYRELLSKCQMWHQRALLDVQRNRLLGQQFKGYVPPAGAGGPAFGGVGGAGGGGSAAAVRPLPVPELERLAFAALLTLASYSGGLIPQPSALVMHQAGAHHLTSGGGGSSGAASGGSVVTHGGHAGGDTAALLQASSASAAGGSVMSAGVGRGGGYGPCAASVADPDAVAAADGILGLGPKRSQMFVRCGSCRASLSLPALVAGSASAVEWLSKQRPHMLACPSCKKTLPRCSLCLLPLGCINPYLQLEHEMRQRTAARAETAGLLAAESGASIRRAGGTGHGGVAAPATPRFGLGGYLSGAAGHVHSSDDSAPAGGPPNGPAVATAASPSGPSPRFDAFPPGQLRDAIAFDDFWCWCQSCKHGG